MKKSLATLSIPKQLLRRASLHSLATVHPNIDTAIQAMGFVQADPIRAPARAQDLILRLRVKGYRADDLETHYPALTNIEEDFFVNYGFVSRTRQALLHPRIREAPTRAEAAAEHLIAPVLNFVKKSGVAAPADLLAHFGTLPTQNAWGGSSQVTTRLLDSLHYRGKLRVARRDAGIKVYSPATHLANEYRGKTSPTQLARQARAVLDWILQLYEPLPWRSLVYLLRLARYGAPQLQAALQEALTKALLTDLHDERVDGVRYLWRRDPACRTAREWCEAREPRAAALARVRLLAPFDPVVWDRARFEHLHDWRYTFEAYVPAPKRKLGYYALPLLWEDRCVGWANLARRDDALVCDLGWVERPKVAAFGPALETELDRMRRFLSLKHIELAKR